MTAIASAEGELCLLCARRAPDADATRRIRSLLDGRIEWDILVETARRHRIIPLVQQTLATIAGANVPAPVARQLQEEARATGRRNLFLAAELLRSVDILSEHEITVIPYKGPALASLVYGDLSLRQFGDLDVVLHQRDVPKAIDVLGARGYEVARDFTGKDTGLFNATLGVTLELHWTITSERHGVQIAPERLWRNLRRSSLGGRSVLTHSAEDLLWILCVHGAQHQWERLIWLCDVAEMVRGTRLDWNRALDDAAELGAGRAVSLGLFLAQDLLGVTLPARAHAAIESDRAVERLGKHVKDWLADPSPGALPLGDAERYFVMLGGSVGDRLRIAYRQVTPYLAPTARDREVVRLPRYLSWLVYVIRPFRLARSYGLTPLRRLLRGLFSS